MRFFLIVFGSLVLIVSAVAHLYVKRKLRPKDDSDFDDIYWEFEDTHPGFARYERLSQITFTGIVIGTLLLFLALVF